MCACVSVCLSICVYLIESSPFLDATAHPCRGRVRPSVPSYFRMMIIAIFKGKKSSIDINGIMSDDEVVASDVPPFL